MFFKHCKQYIQYFMQSHYKLLIIKIVNKVSFNNSYCYKFYEHQELSKYKIKQFFSKPIMCNLNNQSVIIETLYFLY